MNDTEQTTHSTSPATANADQAAGKRPILFFDGVCNLCNSSVQFIIKHDRKKQFLFAPLQSPMGMEALAAVAGQNGKKPDSVILQYNDKYYTKSAAALHALKLLGGPLRLLYAAIIIPAPVRNAIYDLIARNRYKWFGRQDKCMIPTPELKARFISA